MSLNSDAILFFVNFVFNLLLFGCLIFVALAVAFRLIKNANPRWRYLIAATAFLLAAFLPISIILPTR
jgi:hypothetical protein